ncbi:uncharacterized protein BT62DRAFT_922999 [Guyanagaster necrorhizus]|uniref:PABS domain-containing protein n=1 Tax=Guyanagaster necrorhizus TaxID=856835 RepID=A0A9P8ANM1_9AGAR|nr:uncharacterized protein BT62DRAFT_922999 [Guyanagaster necrorhizus MCA 3950]KAG7441994.1 hypothetical protein BT62DRAFT_922999 [Guyanagaster necrorhizus MCA 3950]
MNRRKVENVYVVIDTDIDDVIGMRGRNSNFDFENCPVTSSIATTMAPLTHPSIQGIIPSVSPIKVFIVFLPDGWFGSGGGVVREVLKHDSVTEVVLCDIDEAMIRVSKPYLPRMSCLLSSPKVTVFIGDGFKFLAEHKGRYDAIITDSSDPPYFQLFHDALAPGGRICTQGECLWLHFPLISQLISMTLEIFPVSQYGYTTIPTYPSGQRGFIVCSKEPDRDLSKPLRIHVLPQMQYWDICEEQTEGMDRRIVPYFINRFVGEDDRWKLAKACHDVYESPGETDLVVSMMLPVV